VKIVQYMSDFRLQAGGVTRAVLDLCAVLASSGHEVHLLTLDRSDVPAEWNGASGRPRASELGRSRLPIPRLNAHGRGEAMAAIAAADVVHLHVPWDPVCVQLAAMAHGAKRPYVITIHGMLDDWCMARNRLKKRLFHALAGRRLLERAAAVHCTAQAEAEQSAKWYPGGRSACVPLITDLSPFEHLPGSAPARRRFERELGDGGVALFLSRLHPKKGLEALIDAAGMMRTQGVHARVMIAGSGDEAYVSALRRRVAEMGLGDGVRFLGFVSGMEKLSLYQAADMLVLPTSQENWGFVLVEALACGTPVVTTKGVDIWPELASSGGARIVPAEAGAIAETVAELLSDPARRRAMGEAGRQWVLESLSADRVIAGYEAMYAAAQASSPRGWENAG